MKRRREPGHPLFWLTIAALLFLVVPYPFAGASEPRLWHLPLWLFVSLGASVAIAVLSAWRIWAAWRLDDDD